MLRITQNHSNGLVLLRLEGKLLGPWTDELLAQLPRDEAEWGRARLDLSQVSFVDAAGTALLRRAVHAGAQILSASSFVAELLHTRKP